MAALVEAFHEVAQSRDLGAVVGLHATTHEVAEGTLDIAVVEKIVGDLIEKRGGIGLERFLGTVPSRVAIVR
jgi:hypothetical protein